MAARRALEDAALQALLGALGASLSLASRRLESVRSQVTRDLVYEVSAGDRVVRQWRFEAQARRISSRGGRLHPADGGVHFADSALALRRLLSADAVDGIVDDWHAGRVRVHGRTELLLWFYGLTRRVVRRGRAPGPVGALPGGYVRPDPTSHGVERVVVEPAVDVLDPAWTAAGRARALLPNVRAAGTGEAGGP